MIKKENDKYIKDNDKLKKSLDLNIVGVQPLTGPVGIAFALRYLYQNQYQNDLVHVDITNNISNYIINNRRKRC